MYSPVVLVFALGEAAWCQLLVLSLGGGLIPREPELWEGDYVCALRRGLSHVFNTLVDILTNVQHSASQIKVEDWHWPVRRRRANHSHGDIVL